MKAMAASGPAVIELILNDRTQQVTIPAGDWGEIPLKSVPFSQGANRLKILVKSGTAVLDWIAFD